MATASVSTAAWLPRDVVERAIRARTILSIPTELIKPNPRNPRKYFDPAAMQRLSRDIASRKRQVSVAIVTPTKGDRVHQFKIVAGHRRWLACCEAGRAFDAEVRVYGDPDDEYEDTCSENCNREDLEAMEYAAMLKEGLKLKRIKKLKYAEERYDALGQRFGGKSGTWAKDYLSLNDLVPEAQVLIGPETPKNERLDIKSAARISTLPAEGQRQILVQLKLEPISAKRTKAVVDRYINESGAGEHRRGTKPGHHGLRDFERALRLGKSAIERELEKIRRNEGKDFRKFFAAKNADDLRRYLNEITEISGLWADFAREIRANGPVMKD